jgi:hypothetical protein
MTLINDRFLHPIIYIIADRPTKQNVSEKVPLVGTQSYKTLLKWCGDMDIDVTRVRFFNQSDRPFSNEFSLHSIRNGVDAGHIRVIALGKNAMDYLLALDLNEFFVLPHPSGLNRALNDKKALQHRLYQCRSYVYSGVLEVSAKSEDQEGAT